jgi:predicted component of type VI protein secretion system
MESRNREKKSMSLITLQVLDGADRGRLFTQLRPPVTIGREEGNDVQLNDERVSRFHIKIQEDNERLVLTDLQSTNGTKVNGEDIKLRILRYGDIITIGRSLLRFGSRDEIALRFARLRGEQPASRASDGGAGSREPQGQLDLNPLDDDLQAKLFRLEPPDLPSRLSPGQAAQLAEVLDYFHLRVRELIRSADPEPKATRVVLAAEHWQQLVDIQSRLAEYLRAVSDPDIER